MTNTPKHPVMTDTRMEIAIGQMLRIGVSLAAVTVLAGGILYLLRNAAVHPEYTHFTGTPANLRHLTPILEGALHGDSRALIQLGLLILIATPIARVAFAAFAFLLERDHLYVAISLVVLAVLLFSLLHH